MHTPIVTLENHGSTPTAPGHEVTSHKVPLVGNQETQNECWPMLALANKIMLDVGQKLWFEHV